MPEHTRILCYGIGNISRGDDGLGPELLDWLQQQAKSFSQYEITYEPAFQLQPENIYEFKNQDAILFLDADARFETGIQFNQLQIPTTENPFVSHALSPTQLLKIHNDLMAASHPPAFLLSMGASDIGLHEGLSSTAKKNLELAQEKCSYFLQQPLQSWPDLTTNQEPPNTAGCSATS